MGMKKALSGMSLLVKCIYTEPEIHMGKPTACDIIHHEPVLPSCYNVIPIEQTFIRRLPWKDKFPSFTIFSCMKHLCIMVPP